jgi:hypothetical protein
LLPKQALIDFANSLPGGTFGASPWTTYLQTILTAQSSQQPDSGQVIVFDSIPEPFAQFVVDPNDNNQFFDALNDFSASGFSNNLE